MAGRKAELKSAGRPRDPEADAAILRAAMELFAERGVDGTSIEQIAKRAGVARLTVYRRWSSKEELLAQAIMFSRNAPVLSDEEYDTLPWPELFARLGGTMTDAVDSRDLPRLLAQLIGSAFTHPSLMEAFWASSGGPRWQGGVRLVERAKREGMLPAQTDPEVVLDMIVGGIIFRLVMPHRQQDDLAAFILAAFHQIGLTLPNL